MDEKPLILVTGATGAQGGSVAKYLLQSRKFSVRCLTRNSKSEKANLLKKSGAQIVEGTMDDKESLVNAMKGCHGVFAVTSFWEHFEKEFEHGKNLIDAANESNIQHFVFSSLAYANKISNGQFKVPHLDLKGQLEEYLRTLPLKTTFVHVAFYYENFLSFFPLQKAEDGSYNFGFPQGDVKLAAVSAEDIGGVVAVIFENPKKYIGKTIGIVGSDLTPAGYAETFTRVLNKPVKFNYIPRDVYASFGFPGAEELANMFEFQRLYIPNRQKDLEESCSMFPQIQSFESWLRSNKEKFVL